VTSKRLLVVDVGAAASVGGLTVEESSKINTTKLGFRKLSYICVIR
jgi:hypothetical protein